MNHLVIGSRPSSTQYRYQPRSWYTIENLSFCGRLTYLDVLQNCSLSPRRCSLDPQWALRDSTTHKYERMEGVCTSATEYFDNMSNRLQTTFSPPKFHNAYFSNVFKATERPLSLLGLGIILYILEILGTTSSYDILTNAREIFTEHKNSRDTFTAEQKLSGTG